MFTYYATQTVGDLFQKCYVDIFATPYKRPCKLPKERDFTNEQKLNAGAFFNKVLAGTAKVRL